MNAGPFHAREMVLEFTALISDRSSRIFASAALMEALSIAGATRVAPI